MVLRCRLFIFIVLSCGWPSAYADLPTRGAEKLIVRGSDNYPPFEYIGKNGAPEGFNVDIFRALMDELGYDYDLRLENWDSVVRDLQDQKIDAALGMIYSPERAASVRFTLPTCVINRNFITREQDGYHSFDQLRGKEVIVEKGGWFHRYLQEHGELGIRIVESDHIDQSLEMLSKGRHDAILASELVAYYAIGEKGITGLKVHTMPIPPQNYGIAVNHAGDDLLYQLNLGLQRLKLSGAYDQIYNKWFGIYESRKNKQTLLIALGVFLLVASWLAGFVWLLRKRVSRATRLLNDSQQEVGIAIDAGKISAWTYIVRDRTIHALHGKSLGLDEDGPMDRIYAKIHPEEVGKVRGEFDALSSGEKQGTHISFRAREDEHSPYRYVETKMVFVKATREHPDRIVGTLKDVTDTVLMQQQLEDFRIKTEYIVKTNGIILIQYNIKERMFIRINDAESPVEKSYTIEQYLAMVHPDDIGVAARFLDAMNAAREQKFETEFRIVDGDGDYNWYFITAVAYKYDQQGRIAGYLGMRRNNTKWKAINDDLILLKEKADASNRLKSAFLANMSHEIRTPLNAIVGFSELAAETEDTTERAEYIEIVKKNNALLLQLIGDVLDLSRIESGQVNLAYTTFDFPEYFRNLGVSLKIKETAAVRLVCVNRYENLMVCSDQNRIAQVITNFVTNAFKFTERGTVTLNYTYENDGIKISVSDTGIGIAPGNKARIFDRFEKVNDFAQGTGLGLCICKEIAEALRGQIGVSSEPGAGSTFWFWIPCCTEVHEGVVVHDIPVKAGAALTNAGSPQRKETALVPNRKTVLIAEDLENNFIMISSLLRDSYNILRAENGLEAVEKARRYKPDLILMDMKMPLMGGLEATRKIREFDGDIPIIALTAYVFDTNRQDAMDAGCTDFLTKPVNRSVLTHLLKGFIPG